jgi:hypothetical protein
MDFESKALAALDRLPKLPPQVWDRQGVERYSGDQRRTPFKGSQNARAGEMVVFLLDELKRVHGSIRSAVNSAPVKRVAFSRLQRMANPITLARVRATNRRSREKHVDQRRKDTQEWRKRNTQRISQYNSLSEHDFFQPRHINEFINAALDGRNRRDEWHTLNLAEVSKAQKAEAERPRATASTDPTPTGEPKL